jgi:hypothetical protein
MTVMTWLLDSEPAIRWQVMRDLTHEPNEIVAAERSRLVSCRVAGVGCSVARALKKRLA